MCLIVSRNVLRMGILLYEIELRFKLYSNVARNVSMRRVR